MKNIFYTIILSFLFSFSVFADGHYQDENKYDDHSETIECYTAVDENEKLFTGRPTAVCIEKMETFAEQGDADTQFELAHLLLYHKDSNIEDKKQGMNWLLSAAEQGHTKAQHILGYRYLFGEGILQNYKDALKWFRLAAEQGYSIAQSDLGDMYKQGRAVKKDLVTAHMWFNIAASTGVIQAKQKIKEIESEMTLKQIEKAQKLARECVKKNYKDCG